jgi:hypothetical protein
VRLQKPKAVNPLEVAAAFVESGLIAWAEPDFVQKYQKFVTPSDPLYLNQWHLYNNGQGGSVPDADVDAPEAWDIERGSASITIAVVDDGVQLSPPDLAGRIFTNPGEIPGNGV